MIHIDWEAMRKKSQDEWAGPCPVCGGRDRFMVWRERKNYWCRQCGLKGWLDGDAHIPSPDEVAALERRIAERQANDALMHDAAVKRLVDAAYWRGYHDCMNDQQREYWNQEGIPDWAIDYFDLGYCPAKRISYEGQTFTYPAYTIPIISPGTHTAVNVQYRLIGAPAQIGKYRQEYNLPAAPFFFNTDRTEGHQVLMVEGSKKAIVIGCHTGDSELQIIGLPSNTPSEKLIQTVSAYETVFVALDPGAERQAERIGGIVGKRARIVTLPAKPDDLIVRYGGTADDIRQAMQQATVA